MLDKILRRIAHRAYRQGLADGYEKGRASRQQQEYVRGYSDGKAEGREMERRDVQATRAKLDDAARWGFEQGFQQGLIAQADATLDGSQGLTRAA